MKKTLLCAGLMAIGFANAQTGKVGINTENPNETLEINGTLRVDNMPLSGEGKIYDGAETTETLFTANSVMATDDQGNVGKMAFPFGELVIGEGDVEGSLDAFEEKVFPYTSNPNYTDTQNGILEITEDDIRTAPRGTSNFRAFRAVLLDKTFNIKKRSLVIFNVTTHFNITGIGKQDSMGEFYSLTNAQPKRIGVRVFLNGNVVDDSEAKTGLKDRAVYGFYYNNKKIDGGTQILASGANVTIGEMTIFRTTGTNIPSIANNGGPFSVSGSKTLILDKGDYSVQVEGVFQMHYADASSIHVVMGRNNDIFDVIAIPLEL